MSTDPPMGTTPLQTQALPPLWTTPRIPWMNSKNPSPPLPTASGVSLPVSHSPSSHSDLSSPYSYSPSSTRLKSPIDTMNAPIPSNSTPFGVRSYSFMPPNTKMSSSGCSDTSVNGMDPSDHAVSAFTISAFTCFVYGMSMAECS